MGQIVMWKMAGEKKLVAFGRVMDEEEFCHMWEKGIRS